MKILLFLMALTTNYCLFAQDYNFTGNKAESVFFSKANKDYSIWKKMKLYYDSSLNVNSLKIYGGGQLFSLLTEDSESNNEANLSGSIGANFATKTMLTNIYFSYNGKKDIGIFDLSTFGSTLINPDRNGNSMALTHEVKTGIHGGAVIKGFISDQNWQLDSSTVLDASPFVFKAGIYLRPYHNLGNTADSLNNYSLTFQLLFTHRSIFGDFGNLAGKMIGGESIDRQGYNGFECNIGLQINKMKIFTAYTYNPQVGVYLPGFSKSQVTFGLNVTGDLITLK